MKPLTNFDEGVPTCPECGSLMRPDVVWFGENLHPESIEAAYQASQNADIFLSIGTSSIVQPSASLLLLAYQHRAVLVEINPQGLLFTIIEDKEFCLSQEVTIEKLGLEVDSLESTDEEDITKFISKELRRIILDNKLGENIEGLNRIFLYGDMVKDNILESLQNNYNVRIDRANPFRRLLFAPNVSVDENIWSRPETFTVCVGAALRKR